METSRKDIQRNKQQTICPNSSLIGYSTNKLRYGDLFAYREQSLDGGYVYYFAKCQGRVKPNTQISDSDSIGWHILAQTSNTQGVPSFTYERWVLPEDVVSIEPKEHANKHILAYFEEREPQMI